MLTALTCASLVTNIQERKFKSQQGQKNFKKGGELCNHVFKQLTKAAAEWSNYSLEVREGWSSKKVIKKRERNGSCLPVGRSVSLQARQLTRSRQWVNHEHCRDSLESLNTAPDPFTGKTGCCAGCGAKWSLLVPCSGLRRTDISWQMMFQTNWQVYSACKNKLNWILRYIEATYIKMPIYSYKIHV